MSDTHTLLVEGWRMIPHSFAIANQFQCLEFLTRPDLRLFHRDMPFCKPNWQPVRGLFSPEHEQQLAAIPSPHPGVVPDVVLRMTYPYDLAPSAVGRTVVFGTAEYGCVPKDITYDRPLSEWMRDTDTLILTCSNWSREGFIQSGADPSRVVLVPLGFDPAIFHPLPEDERAALRASHQCDGFTFFTMGAMTSNKGMPLLLKAFATVLEKHPNCRLLLKGLDSLYESQTQLQSRTGPLSQSEVDRIVPRITYIGHTLSFADIAMFHRMADAYVSPYHAEGFNLPVLEAAACGTPVICTKGGSTDDFTTPDFALHINAKRRAERRGSDTMGIYLELDFDHLVQHMLDVIERPEIGQRARRCGPAFLQAGFTWKRVVDRLLQTLGIGKSTQESET